MMESNYTFSANARPIVNRQKYREIPLEPTQQNCNIAVDPRIKRGSTFNRANAMTEQITRLPIHPRKSLVRRSADDDFETIHQDGFSEALVQTDEFDGNVVIIKNEESIAVQTDPYSEKPIVHRKPPPLRAVGIKTNVPGTSLFDFDVQVQPMVTALVQKALTQAAMEYQEEEELAYMQMYLKAFQHTAQKEGEAIKRLEEAELKKYEEKEEIIKKKLQIEEAQLELRSKVMARGFAEWFIWDIQNDVMESLHQRGYFYDEVERDIEQTFLPWLTQVVEAEIAKPSVPFAIVDKVVEIAVDLCNQQSNQSAIDIQIEEDQKEIKRNKLLRLMIAEDIVAQKMRQAKKMGKLKKQKKNGDDDGNEEEEEDNDSNAPTESTNESSDY